jgi:hypothetical protein
MLLALGNHHPALLNVYTAPLLHTITLNLSSCSFMLPTLHSAPSCCLHYTLLPHATYTTLCFLMLPTLQSAPSCYLHYTLLPHAAYTTPCSLMLPTLHPAPSCYLHYTLLPHAACTTLCSLMLPTLHSASSCYLTLNTYPCTLHTAYTDCLSSRYSMLLKLHDSLRSHHPL